MHSSSHLQQYLYFTTFFVAQYGWQTGTSPSWQPHFGQQQPGSPEAGEPQEGSALQPGSPALDNRAAASAAIAKTVAEANVFISYISAEV